MILSPPRTNAVFVTTVRLVEYWISCVAVAYILH